MKILLGIIIGVLIMLTVKTAYAGNKTWNMSVGNNVQVERLQDGGINCYVATSHQAGGSWANQGSHVSIACIKVK